MLVTGEQTLAIGYPSLKPFQDALHSGAHFLAFYREAVSFCREADARGVNMKAFLECAQEVCESQPKEVFTSWYDGQGNLVADHTFGDIWESSERIANYLRSECNLNDPQKHIVVLCYDFGINFFHAFLGCLRAGVVPALTYPPGPPLVKSLPKLQKVVQDCQPALILTDSRIEMLRRADTLNPLSVTKGMWPQDVKYVNTDRISASSSSARIRSLFTLKRRTPGVGLIDLKFEDNDLAFIQYSSGSTGEPKGVMVTHGNISANVYHLREASLQVHRENGYVPPRTIGVSWLPPYHDMGLICGISMPFAYGWRMHMISPLDFIRNPLLWIELMSSSKAHWTKAPDFSYRLVARKILAIEQEETAPAKKRLSRLDLTNAQYLQNAAEPIRLDTKDLLVQALSKYKLGKAFFGTGYGLAENVASVCHLYGCTLSRPMDSQLIPIVAVGHRRTIPSSFTLKIVDPVTLMEAKDEAVGEIWISGSCVALGYFRKPDLTAEMFRATLHGGHVDEKYMRTGDLGFFQDDYLFICGRIKDVIIVNGVNYYPQDVEAVVQDASKCIRPGCVAAFSSGGESGQLEIVFEVRAGREEESHDICKLVHREVSLRIGLVATRVVAIKERSISKTTSGKIQRRKNRERLRSQDHHIIFDFCLQEEGASQVLSPGSLLSSASSFSNTPMHLRSCKRMTVSAGEVFDDVVLLFLPKDYDPDASWEDLGLTSISAMELQQALSSRLTCATVPTNFTEVFRTPSSLRRHMIASGKNSFPIDKTNLRVVRRGFSWTAMSILQGILCPVLLILFSIPVIPAWYAGLALSKNTQVSEHVQSGKSFARWIWLPFALPVWMVSFTVVLIAAKWTVVWKYKEQEINYTSLAGLRWWFVDRLAHMWEFWVGRLIKDTPLLNIVYILAGANIHMSARLNAFIREFDLVQVDAGAEIEQSMICRIFGGWQGDNVYVRFRRVRVGRRSKIRGMLEAGATVEESSLVERLSVVREGSKVPDSRLAVGNPAQDHGQTVVEIPLAPSATACFRVFWLFCELYIFFACLLGAELIDSAYNPIQGRYGELSRWILMIGISTIFSFLLGIPLKWVAIGKRRPGSIQYPVLVEMIDWAVDYHFRISSFILVSFTSNSRLWNLALRCYGLDIDMTSKLIPDSIPPSQADLVKIRKSFLSNVTISAKKDGAFQKVEIQESSVGYNVHIDAGVTVQRSTVSPLTSLQENRIGPNAAPVFRPNHWRILALTELAYLAFVGLIFLSFVPTFDCWIQLAGADIHSISFYEPTLAFCLFLQSAIWILLLNLVQLVALGFGTGVIPPFYAVYLTMAWAVQIWSFLPLLWGTRMINGVWIFLRTKVDGRFLFQGRVLHDFPLLTFRDGSVLDSAHAIGHYQVYNELVRGPVEISGVVHPGTSVMAHAVLTSEESGPWRFYLGVGNADKVEQAKENPSFPVGLSTNNTRSSSLEL